MSCSKRRDPLPPDQKAGGAIVPFPALNHAKKSGWGICFPLASILYPVQKEGGKKKCIVPFEQQTYWGKGGVVKGQSTCSPHLMPPKKSKGELNLGHLLTPPS